jgi:hypothetical protein
MVDIFGAPGSGVHSIRFMGLAIVDLGLTTVVAIWLSRAKRTSFWKTLAWLLGAGICIHRAFGVRTTLDKLLFD